MIGNVQMHTRANPLVDILLHCPDCNEEYCTYDVDKGQTPPPAKTILAMVAEHQETCLGKSTVPTSVILHVIELGKTDKLLQCFIAWVNNHQIMYSKDEDKHTGVHGVTERMLDAWGLW